MAIGSTDIAQVPRRPYFNMRRIFASESRYLNDLARLINNGTLTDTLSGVSVYLADLKYFPLNSEIFKYPNVLQVSETVLGILNAATTLGIPCTDDRDGSPLNIASNVTQTVNRGFYMGKFRYDLYKNGDFTDFEPYSHVLIYLPFFGYVELSIKDIYDKVLLFRLCIDFWCIASPGSGS